MCVCVCVCVCEKIKKKKKREEIYSRPAIHSNWGKLEIQKHLLGLLYGIVHHVVGIVCCSQLIHRDA